ncbi:hypothetical protein NST89_03300 [Caldifermentibacillus hisashii]
MVTRSLLVVVFVRKSPFFGDETQSRHHFEARTVLSHISHVLSKIHPNF